MFHHLFNFGHQRSIVQAIGFYLFYLVTGVIVVALAGAGAAMIATSVGSTFGFDEGFQLGAFLSIAMTTVLALLVLRAKGQFRHVGYVLVGLLTVVGAIVGGLVLGLIFVAFLTTRPTREAASLRSDGAHPVGASGAF